jgi:hypothetical protein
LWINRDTLSLKDCADGNHSNDAILAHEALFKKLFAMLAYVVSEGRLFALKPSDWSMLLGGVTLCGILTLLLG